MGTTTRLVTARTVTFNHHVSITSIKQTPICARVIHINLQLLVLAETRIIQERAQQIPHKSLKTSQLPNPA